MKKFSLIISFFMLFLSSAGILQAQEDHTKSSWYIGFGLGSGQGNIEGDSFSDVFDMFGNDLGTEADAGTPFTFNFGVGAILTPNFHLGLDISAIRQSATYELFGYKGDINLQINNYLAAATYYPFETGLSLKGGLGFSVFQMSTGGDLFVEDSDSYSGKAFLVGAGYDLWLGETFNLGLHAEYSKQTYSSSDAPKDSDFFNIYVSFYWL